MNNQNQLKTGGDPRALLDYISLRDELTKLNHPARPDVNWHYVEQLSLSLFSNHGVELQTLSSYTLARTHISGIMGLNEGLLILEKLLLNHWGDIWPQPAHARMEILAGLSQRLLSVLRTFTFEYADLPQIYQAEQRLNAVLDMLQRLELKNASQVGSLSLFMHNSATRLENMNAGSAVHDAILLSNFFHKETPCSELATDVVPPTAKWRSFASGMLTMLVVGGGIFWGVDKIILSADSPESAKIDDASLAAQQPLLPMWCQNYAGFTLVSRTEPIDADNLKAQWQHYIATQTLSQEAVSGWNQGMEGLQNLTRRLNELDERKGKYLTGSELKSMVFTIMQNFGRSVPVEEQLFQLSQTSSGTPAPAALLLQTDIHLNQLLNRYALIKQQATTP